MIKTIAAVMSILSFFGCRQPESPSDPPALKERQDIVLSKAQKEYVQAGNSFAFNLMKQINKEKSGKSWIMSPLSVQYALGMVLNGALGETASQISNTLGYGKDGAAGVNGFCKALTDGIGEVDPSTAVKIANVLVYNTHNDNGGGVRLKEPFVRALSDFYYAGVETFDFTADNKAALDRINGWSSEKTNGMIPTILDEVDPRCLSYFLNAVYFKGMWANKFNKDYTSKKTFTRDDGSTLKVDMMSQTEDFGYFGGDKYKALSMPYGNGAFKMTVILPHKGVALDDVAASLDPAAWESLRYLRTREVDVEFPKFETASSLPLNDALKALGMELPFKAGADFTAMSDAADHISIVFQKAKIKVDEEGSEAAAVTVVGMMEATALPNPENYVFHAERPFLYVISEVSTGAILFMGRFNGD